MDSDRYSLDLLNTVLGEGMASRLFLSLREDKGLVYEVGSSVAKLTDTGSMTIYAGTDPSNANDAIQGIIEELDRAIEHIDQSELDRARELIKGRLFLGLEDTRSVSSFVFKTIFPGFVFKDQGKLFFQVLYSKIKENYWDPTSDELFSGEVSGIGWAINFAALRKMLSFLR